MNALKTRFPTATAFVSNEMAAWLQRGQTLGRLWNVSRGRFEK